MNDKYQRHEMGYKSGGIHMNKYGNSTNSQKVVGMMLKKVQQKLYKGEIPDLFRLDKPVIINTEYPLMECFAMDFQYINELMDAYHVKHTQNLDPIERMKYLSTGLIAGQYNSITVLRDRAPIDPLLGETLFLEKKVRNVQMYFECISASPQIVRYIYESKHLKISGSAWITVSINPIANKAIGTRNGTNILTFANGDQVELKCSKLEISGILMGDLVSNMCSPYQMIDRTNGIMCEVIYNPEYSKKSSLQKITSGIKGMFGSKNSTRLADDIEINIYQVSFKDNKVIKGPLLKQGVGNWLSHIVWDDEVLWHLNQDTIPFQKKNVLLSDSTLRHDILEIIQEDMEKAQKERDILIDQIDKDKALRKKNNKQNDKKVQGQKQSNGSYYQSQ